MGEAFILAFTFPNLFRRMLGEGTLTSAFIPVFTEALRNKSKKSPRFAKPSYIKAVSYSWCAKWNCNSFITFDESGWQLG